MMQAHTPALVDVSEDQMSPPRQSSGHLVRACNVSGTMQLEHCSAHLVLCEFCKKLTGRHVQAGQHEYVLRASTDEDAAEWFQELQSSCSQTYAHPHQPWMQCRVYVVHGWVRAA